MRASAHNALPDERDNTSVEGSKSLASQRRLLLVDEQAHVLRVMRLNLDRHGYEVDAALGSSIALQLLQEHSYDALIITSNVADMSARGLCELALRKLGINVPLVLVCDPEDNVWIDSFAFVELIDSPISLRWIVARLGEAFGDYESL